jgi:hypothetical protein
MLLALLFAAAVSTGPSIAITDGAGKAIPVEAEDTGGIADRPLVKTRERLDAKYKKDFLFLDKVSAPLGTSLTGKWTVSGGPMRLTVYELAKAKDADHRTLRVMATKFLKDGETAEFSTKVEPLEEQVFLVTAEKTKDEKQLDKHLEYMATQDDELVVKGFGTSWDLSQLKFKMSGKAAGKSDDFAKDADWLVGNLVDPQWVMSIRVVQPGS